MYCSNCGKECTAVTYCPNCGNPVSPNQNTSLKNIVKESKVTNRLAKFPVKFIAVLAALSAAIVVGIVALTGGSGYSTYEKLATAFVEATFELDTEKLVSCFPDFLVERKANNYGLPKATRKELAEELEKANKLSGETKQSVKIVSIDIFRELSTDLDLFGYFKVSNEEREKISQVLELDVKYSLDNEYYTDMIEIICFKEGSKWYLLKAN